MKSMPSLIAPAAMIVMGVSGCGKSSVSQALHQHFLAGHLPCVLIEGDEFHPPANIEKMRAGIALNDDDRQPWLERLNAELKRVIANHSSAVLACSALKESYRQTLRQGLASFHVLHLKGSFDVIEARMKARQHKYMPASLLHSQFAALETPATAIELNIEESVEHLARQAFLAITSASR
jgi:gluconokinase